MKVFFSICLVVVMTFPVVSVAQLSKGEGAMATVPGKNLRCYLPKHFVIQNEPPGVMHKESGSFVIAIKVPAEKRASTKEGLSREFFEDKRYKLTSFHEKDSSVHKFNTKGKLYTIRYIIQDFEFERKTLLVTVANEQYLIIGNYPVKYAGYVKEEIEKVMANFIIR